jgi:hypothetical protein
VTLLTLSSPELGGITKAGVWRKLKRDQNSDSDFLQYVNVEFAIWTKKFGLLPNFPRFAMGERRTSRYSARRYSERVSPTMNGRYAILGKVAMLSRVRVSERKQACDPAYAGNGRY